MRFIFVILLNIWATASIAIDSRYELKGDTLIFDMTIEKPGYEFTRQLEMYDEMWIRWHLEGYPEIRTLKLTGPGGFMPAAREIANLLVKYEVDTIAYGECISACTTVFLGGKQRDIEEGTILGFINFELIMKAINLFMIPKKKRWVGKMSLSILTPRTTV